MRRGIPERWVRSWAVGLVLALTLLLTACQGGEELGPNPRGPGIGQPRPFLMGFSSVPTAPTDEAYRAAFRFAGSAAEVILIQRAPIWEDFLPGQAISERTENLTRVERDLARQAHLKLFLAVDPTDPNDRGRLAALPDELRGRDFSDTRVRAAFISYAKYLALNYKPAYMALGVEVNMFFNRRGDAAFRNFQSLYFEAYDAVKEVSPGTLVFPTFQYEDLLGLLAGERRQPAWTLVTRFEPKLDMVAFSSFPGFAYEEPSDLPADYYRQIKQRTERPVAFVSLGWSSAVRRAESMIEAEGAQAAFVERILDEAEALDARLVVWYLARDPTVTPDAGFLPLAATGLHRPDGQPKAAWWAWRGYADRPPPRN
jgi:hypothetical protein